jgi:hypothetical protein
MLLQTWQHNKYLGIMQRNKNYLKRKWYETKLWNGFLKFSTKNTND